MKGVRGLHKQSEKIASGLWKVLPILHKYLDNKEITCRGHLGGVQRRASSSA